MKEKKSVREIEMDWILDVANILSKQLFKNKNSFIIGFW